MSNPVKHVQKRVQYFATFWTVCDVNKLHVQTPKKCPKCVQNMFNLWTLFGHFLFDFLKEDVSKICPNYVQTLDTLRTHKPSHSTRAHKFSIWLESILSNYFTFHFQFNRYCPLLTVCQKVNISIIVKINCSSCIVAEVAINWWWTDSLSCGVWVCRWAALLISKTLPTLWTLPPFKNKTKSAQYVSKFWTHFGHILDIFLVFWTCLLFTIPHVRNWQKLWTSFWTYQTCLGTFWTH